MEQFLDALRTLSLGDILRLLAILIPLIGGIWAAMLWAFKSRLDSLETSLKLHREDFELQLGNEMNRRMAEVNADISRLRSQLESEKKSSAELHHYLKMLHELAERPDKYREEMWSLWRLLDDRYFHVREKRSKQGWDEMHNTPLEVKEREPEYLAIFRAKHGSKEVNQS